MQLALQLQHYLSESKLKVLEFQRQLALGPGDSVTQPEDQKREYQLCDCAYIHCLRLGLCKRRPSAVCVCVPVCMCAVSVCVCVADSEILKNVERPCQCFRPASHLFVGTRTASCG